MADRIQLRRDTAANWTAYNPILLEGEPGIEIDTDQWKLGDGVHTWSQLAYRGGECVQQRGQSTTVAMSQKAVTDELNLIGVFDISAHNLTDGQPTKYADLTAALGAIGANVPEQYRVPGMTVRYVQSSDNKYVQYRLMANDFSATTSDWQGVDDEPTAGSDNLVKSGGVLLYNIIRQNITRITKNTMLLPENMYAIIYSSGTLGIYKKEGNSNVKIKDLTNDDICYIFGVEYQYKDSLLYPLNNSPILPFALPNSFDGGNESRYPYYVSSVSDLKIYGQDDDYSIVIIKFHNNNVTTDWTYFVRLYNGSNTLIDSFTKSITSETEPLIGNTKIIGSNKIFEAVIDFSKFILSYGGTNLRFFVNKTCINLIDDKVFITPSRFRVFSGLEYYLYTSYLTEDGSITPDIVKTISLYEAGKSSFGNVIISRTTDIYDRVSITDIFGNTHKSAPIDLKVSTTNMGDGLTKKILFIGDSLTEQAYYIKALMENYLNNDTLNLELLGTRGSTYKHEGRSGWAAFNYFQNSGNPGGVSNPFYNPTSQTFDFSYYMNSQNYSSVDIVCIFLGSNESENTNYVSYINSMISSIKAFNSNVKILMWLCPNGYYIGPQNMYAITYKNSVIKGFINEWDNKENNNIFLVPVRYFIHPTYDFPHNEIYKDIIHVTDWVHPNNTTGADSIAKILYAYIKYVSSL